MVAWRLLNLETYDAFMNMAIDEAIMTARIRDTVPNTVRFYRWKPSAVSIGRFQSLEREIFLENCMKQGIDVVRRISGGGAVYHDCSGEITYSVVSLKDDLEATGATTVYKRVYLGLAEALKLLGLVADFQKGNLRACPNLTITGRKISGSAQAHRKGIVLQHGTLLVNVDLKQMFRFLRVPSFRTCSETAAAADMKITSIHSELGKEVQIKEVSQALVEGFQKSLGVKFTESRLTHLETDNAEELRREKYSGRHWNFGGKPGHISGFKRKSKPWSS